MEVKRYLVIPLALISLLVACGSEGTPGSGAASPEPDDPVVSSPASPGTFPSPQPSRVEPQPGQADVGPISWEETRPVDADTVEVVFWSGVEPCYVLDRVEVAEADRKVTITLYQGHTPTDEEVACIEIAVQKSVLVDLERPVGDRKIVDGAA